MDKLPPVDSASCAGPSAERPEKEPGKEKMVDANLVANNRCYLKSAVQAVTCLLLSQRYNRETQDDFSKDKFNRFYQRALGEDPSLTDVTDLLPPEAQYTSQDFQMAVVRTLAQMVLDKIRQKYRESDSKSFCIKGCIRHNGAEGEVLSLVIRFMNEGKPEEHLVGQLQLEDGDEDYIADLILNHLSEYGLNPWYIISQCYVCGSSLSGCSRDLHGALQRRLNQRIPNIHRDHRPLSLALVQAIQGMPAIGRFLHSCVMVNNFLLHPLVIESNDRYTQPQTTPLSEPSGYYHLIKNTVLNFNPIYGFLLNIWHDDTMPDELRMNASELLRLLQEKYFFITAKFVLDLLTATELAAGFLPHAPSRKYLPFEAAASQAACRSLISLRSHVCLAQHYTTTGRSILSEGSVDEPVPKRPRMDSSMDDDLDCAVPHTPTLAETVADSSVEVPQLSSDSSDTDSSNESNRDLYATELKAFGTYLSQVLELAIHEMKRRLPQEDLAILEAIYVLFPSSLKFLDMGVCLPLLNITRVCGISLAKEIPVAKPLLSREISASMDLAEASEVVYKYSATFPELYEVYMTAMLMSIPQSACERSFPAPVQTATLSEHDINVAIVAHEHAITSSLCMDEFVAAFSRKDKRLVL